MNILGGTMLYLLDANVLIDANRDYYSTNQVPEFWEWLVYMGKEGNVKIPIEIYEEFKNGNDSLAVWAREGETKTALLLNEDVESALISRVINEGYANDLTDVEIERLGRDPFLIAYAMVDITGRCVVTTEVSRPRQKRANRHVPDVCDTLGISWCHSFDLYRHLGFSTNWKDLRVAGPDV